MTIAEILDRELVAPAVLVRRMELVTVIVDALQRDTGWKDADDLMRRRAAKRIAFAHWRINDMDGWGDALRNRRMP